MIPVSFSKSIVVRERDREREREKERERKKERQREREKDCNLEPGATGSKSMESKNRF